MAKLLVLLLFAGHILGDFYFQSSQMAESKKNSLKSLFAHSVIYAGTMGLVVISLFGICSIFTFISLSIIAATHFVVDFIGSKLKSYEILITEQDPNRKQKNKTFREGIGNIKRYIFFVDQIIHVLVLFLVGYYYTMNSKAPNLTTFGVYVFSSQKIILNVVGTIVLFLLVITPSSILIREILHVWSDNIPEVGGFENAGKHIGQLERIIIAILLLHAQYGAIGFVLTAKSIARYNLLAEDAGLAEYYLIGTLLSLVVVLVSFYLLTYLNILG